MLSDDGYQEVAFTQVVGSPEDEDNEADKKHLFKYKLLDYTNRIRYKDEARGTNEPYYLKGKHFSLASRIFSLLRLKQLANIMGE